VNGRLVKTVKSMKGQLIFEFVIAAFILFSIVLFTINNLSISMYTYHTTFVSNFMESRAMQISEVLMNDPVNGIVSEWPLLSTQKMTAFNDTCFYNYLDVLANFSVIENYPYTNLHHMHVIVNGSDGEMYVDCGRMTPGNITSSTVTRFGFVPPPENKIATIQVVVW
jgi:hypothetical protein